MRTLSSAQLGNTENDDFALGSFLPDKYKQQVQPFFDQLYLVFNCSGVFTKLRELLRPSLHNENKEERIQALEKLDKELKGKKSKDKKKKYEKVETSEDEEVDEEDPDLKDIEIRIKE